MDSTITTTEQQTLATTPIMNSSSRRKQSKPNRLEHIIVDPPAPLEPIVSSLTQYHVAAEQQHESALIDDDSDRNSLNCEDGSLSSQSPNEHYAMEDILNRSRRSSHPTHRTNDKTNFEENIDSNDQQEEQQQIGQTSQTNFNVLDFSLKFDDNNKNLFNSSNRSRALNPTGKSRSLKRKHPSNGNLETKNVNSNGPTRIFHADAFCSICRKEFCNKYFLKTHLANKHGIFDHQSLASSLSTPSMIGLTTSTDLNSDPTNLQHSFTMVSTLLQNSQEELSSSPRSDFVENVRTNDQDDVDGGDDDDEENGEEFSSIRQQMNGVIAGDDDDDQQIDQNPLPDDQQTNDDDDEQDGTNPTSFIHLPQQIATILRNENSKRNSLSLLNENDDEEQDQQEINANSPTNSLDYSQQQQQATTSSSQSGIITTTTTGPTATTNIATANLPRQSSAKLPEDFCDICQKHFCNKYYLRKHKLDVHGVQTDCNIKPYKRIDNNSLANKNSVASSSASQLSSTIQLPSTFPAVTFNPSTVQQSLGILLNPIFSPLVQSQSVTGGETTSLISNKRRYTDNSNESSSSSTMATSNLGKPTFPPSLLTVASDVAQVFANQLASVANNSSSSSTNSTTSVGNGGSGTTTTTTKSQISTCHLCGKKFQTNDYLQLHLMNKHQITTDLSTIESIEQRTKSSNLIKSSNGSVNSSTVKKIKLETNETATTSNATNVNLVKISSTVASPIDPNSSVIPGIVDTYFAAKMADRVSCDICHKQVCNKYFLKTHKLKVHGVGPDSSTVSSSSSSTTNQLNNGEGIDDLHDQQQSRSSFDGSPPQLVVDEMNSIGNEPGVIPSPDALTASVNNFLGMTTTTTITTTTATNSTAGTTENVEIAKTTNCEICSKSFPTKFLHVHMNNAHGIQQAPLIVNGTLATSTTTTKPLAGSNPIKRTLSNGNNGTNPVRLKQTPQVQLRVTCQVCKKELCNKYFLRAHMRNVHNLSVDDLRLIQPATSPKSESPSSKQTFSLSSNLLSTNETNSTSNENETNHFNGHTTDSNESESFHIPKDFTSYSLSSPLTTTATTIKSSTNDNNNNNNRLLSMQPFLVESDDDLYKDLFVPCMVYLPCRHRVTKPLEISLRLKPVDNPNSTATTPPTATASIAD